jgi:hypothetical protein
MGAAADLKNTTDDIIPTYLNSIQFVQSHYQTNVRLALGYSAVIIAGVLFYFDWKFGWDATKAYTLPAVVAYCILNGGFTYWMFVVEKGTIYTGEKDGVKVGLTLCTQHPAVKLICRTAHSFVFVGQDNASL